MAVVELVVELHDEVSKGAKSASGGLSRLENSIKKFEKSALGRTVDKLNKGINRVALAATAAGVAAAGFAAKSIMGLAQFRQTSIRAFDAFATGAETGEDLFNSLRAVAKDIGLDIREVTEQALRFRNVGFDQRQSELLIAMGADMQALGRSTGEVNQILDTMSKAQARGAFDSRALNQLARAGVTTESVFEGLSKQLGVSIKDVERLMEDGSITVQQALNAIADTTMAQAGTENLGDAARAAGGDIANLWDGFKAQITDIGLEIAERLTPKITEALQNMSDRFTAFMDSEEGKQFVEDLIGAFESLGRGLLQVGSFFKWIVGPTGRFVAILAAVTAVVVKVIVWGKALVAGFGVVAAAIMQVVAVVKTILSFLGLLATGIAFVAGAPAWLVAAIVAAVVAIGVAIWTFWDEITEFFSSMWEGFKSLGRDIVSGLMEGLKSMASAPIDFIKNLAGGIIGAAKGVLGIASPSRIFEEMAGDVAMGFTIGLDDFPDEIPAVRGMVGSAEAAAESVSGGSRGGSTINFSPEINVTAAPGATRADGEALGSGIADALRREFASLMEDAALEAGV